MKFFQELDPDTGSQRSQTDRTTIMIRPNQKEGMAWPTTETVKALRSHQVLGLMAASTPSGMESSRAKTKAHPPRVMVVPMRSPMICLTGRLK